MQGTQKRLPSWMGWYHRNPWTANRCGSVSCLTRFSVSGTSVVSRGPNPPVCNSSEPSKPREVMPCLRVSSKHKTCAEVDALFVYQTFAVVGGRGIRSPPRWQAASTSGSRRAAVLLAGAASPHPWIPQRWDPRAG